MAGILMLVLGIIGALGGLLVVGVGSMVGQFRDDFAAAPGMPPGFEDVIGPMISIFGGILLVFSLLYIASGIGILRSREWGRILGIVLGIIGSLFWVLGLLGSAGAEAQADTSGGVGFSLVLLLVHAFVVIVLAVRWRRPPVPAAS